MRVSSDLANAALLALAPQLVDQGLQAGDLGLLAGGHLGPPGLVGPGPPLHSGEGALLLGDLADVGLAGPIEVQHPIDSSSSSRSWLMTISAPR